jgi:hypothetical protein
MGFRNNNVFSRAGLLVQRPTPNLEDQVSVFMTHGDRVAQLYPQALGTHFSRLLRHAWVTVGLFFNPGHHTGIIFLQGNWIHIVCICMHGGTIHSPANRNKSGVILIKSTSACDEFLAVSVWECQPKKDIRFMQSL